MPDELMPFGEDPERRPAPANRGPYPSPHWLTREGQQDRRNEAAHAVTVRQITREVELATLEVAKKLKKDLDELDADSRRLTEKKFRLQRAAKESEILGGDDPELRAKFGVLDDEFFARCRASGITRSR